MIDFEGGLPQQDDMRSRVKQFMTMQSVTLADLEKKTGLSRPTILRARLDGENGIETCTLRVLKKVAVALGLRVSDLFLDD